MSKTVLVTGATDGIGRETALELARRGCRVGVHGRNPKKVEEVVQVLRRSGSPNAEGFVADFARLSDVRRLAEEVQARFDRLGVLLNNAGIFAQTRELTADGFESTFQVNHLAPFLLTSLLLPLLERSAPSRVVTVSSVAHQRGQLDFSNLQLERGFTGYGAYANSKLANVLFTFELARRLEGKQVTATCLHPGVINTKLLREGFGAMGASAEQGAETSVYLALSPEVEGISGRYYASSKEAAVASQAKDVEAQRRLWEESERLTGLR